MSVRHANTRVRVHMTHLLEGSVLIWYKFQIVITPSFCRPCRFWCITVYIVYNYNNRSFTILCQINVIDINFKSSRYCRLPTPYFNHLFWCLVGTHLVCKLIRHIISPVGLNIPQNSLYFLILTCNIIAMTIIFRFY